MVFTTPANVRDDTPFGDLNALPQVKLNSGPGAPRRRPKALVGDAGYGFDHTIREVVRRQIKSLLAPRARRGKPATHGSGLGRIRYVIERTLSWMANFRRIVQCYEATGRAWKAFNELACCLVCANRLHKVNAGKAKA